MELRKKTLSFYILSLILLSSCSSLPEGEKKLQEMVDEDQKNAKTVPEKKEMYKGRPIFIKAAAYPQVMPDGDIFAGGDLILSIGREDLSIEDVLK